MLYMTKEYPKQENLKEAVQEINNYCKEIDGMVTQFEVVWDDRGYYSIVALIQQVVVDLNAHI